MNKKIKILHLEDSLKDSELIHSLISAGGIGHDYFLADTKKDFLNILKTENVDLIIADNNLPDYNGNEALIVAREKFSLIPFIFVSGTIGEDDAIIAMQNGATDYVFKTKLERLVPAIKRALHERETESKGKQAEINLKEKIDLIDEQNEKKEKRAAELVVANKELVFQNEEKGKRAAELIIADKELSFQSEEKEKRAAELVIANKELFFQNREKEKRADELIIANKELAYQNKEKEKRAAELIIANKQLAFQNEEKGKRAVELIVANKELAFQNREKEKRADELFIANKELAYQNTEKGKRADELIIANKELAFQNEEKGKRADELIIANKELAFQNREKEKRADELIMANKELAFQNEEKEKRASELIEANKELHFQNEEKEKRTAELIKAREKAEESDNLKSAFLNNLSHEIRTPMNQILGFASFLKDPELPDSDREDYINIINNQSHQLLHIISDIVEISRITTGQVDLKLESFSLTEMMDELFEDFKPKARQRDLQFSLSKKISDTGVMIRGDLAKLKQIVGNLIENAIKFTDKGSIDIEYSKAGDRLVIAVKDTGIGIEEKEKELIFDHFRQIEITIARKYGGMGLGLSISNAYIHMMSGVIRVESEPGKGSAFFVEIPYLPAERIFDNPSKHIQPPAASRPDWQNKTLLIAEDEESNIQFLKAVLRSTGIKLLVAVNGLEAVEHCKTHPEIVVVLMDIKMPRMDGIDATKIIKSFRKDLPIIATTAFAMLGEREYILGAGCDDYLPKPITREVLLAKINKHLINAN
ncbi:MAG: response regulator [Bacteroidota bacterium]